MKILFLTDNFPPEVNAPATRTYEHCREWVQQGVEVTVITCAPNFPQGKVYDGYRNRLFQREEMDGITVIRVWSFVYKNEGALLRVLDFISYAATAFVAGLFVKSDVLIATSPQLFTAISGRLLAGVKRKPWVMEVRDLWPDQLHVRKTVLWDLLAKQAMLSYKSADKLVVVTDGYVEKISAKGIPREKIGVVKNGVRLERYSSYARYGQGLRSRYDLDGKFVIGYLGTHGVAQKLGFIIQAARKIDQKNIVFMFVGDGAEKKDCVEQAKACGLKNCVFVDQVPKEETLDYLSLFDVSLIPLRNDTVYLDVLPSKIFENAAMQKPVLLGVDGEARRLVEGYGCGLFYEPENEQDFLAKVRYFYEHRSELDRFRSGGKKLAADFDRSKLAGEMLAMIRSVVN
ncbi:glycosyltransferase family 4 protein [Prosthecochloris sp. HL-130-GSB]|uniref:glycosyltransferase family 4 protein n=1 Tax=Prosthecochloris sp. HL-130-GSB TaxID=1974213 RepID=UPI000A1C1100|nr:glycosyltransferase family 4 protein [Prosthecochloris sp. HL-130-GSB]ARM31350.1 glycosyltransferase WbuB [Prosthecochloris sp. HL-130-GSB]